MSTDEAIETMPATPAGRTGWTTFAAIMLLIAGVTNALWGWAALRDANAWGDYRPIADATFVGPLEFWGWTALMWSVAVIIGSVLLFMNHKSGQVLGITLAALSAVFWLLVLATFPLMAVAALAIDIIIIYGLAVHWEEPA